MKKVWSIIIVLMLLFGISYSTSMLAFAEATPSFQVSTKEAECGEEVSLTISTVNNPGIASFNLNVNYDSGRLEWIDVQKGTLSGNWDVAVGQSITFIDSDNHSDDIVVATLVFKVKDNASSGLAKVSVSYETGDVFDKNEEDVAFSIVSGGITVKSKEIPVTSIELNKSTLSLKEGENQALTAIVAPSNATDKTVSWTSSDTSVATVADGKVTAVKAGTATVTAQTANGKTATCKVTVTPATVAATEVTLNKSTLSLKEGENQTLTATVLPLNTTDKTVNWTSSDTSVATVSNGKVTAVKAGTAAITAQTANGKTATCKVTVTPATVAATGVTLNKSTLSLKEGENQTLTATVAPSNATDKTVSWTSSDTSIATVKAGKVTAVKAGTATITAKTANGKTATCKVTVTPATVAATGVTLNKSTLSLKEGENQTLTATVAPSNATDKTVSWTSSDTSIATVKAGKVTAVKAGTATITAKTANGKKAACKVTVTAKAAGEVWIRIYGQGRYDTMQAIVKEGFKTKGGTVIVATGESFKDALASAGLAGLYNAPVILTNNRSLSAQAIEELVRLHPSQVFIAGGPVAVSDTVKSQIESTTGTSAKRLMGKTSSGTSAALALQGKGKWSDTAIVATNKSFKDALSVAPLAYAKGMPILLADNGQSLSSDVMNALKTCRIKKIIIVGGEAAVNKNVATQLTKAGYEIQARIWGQTGVDTSAAIAQYGIENGMKPNNMGVATSQNYPDALAGAALCGHNNAVLVLADDKALKNAYFVQKYKGRIERGYIFGGTFAVGNTTKTILEQSVSGGSGIHRYEYVISDSTWTNAFQNARSRGGYLVHINSPEEYMYIKGEIDVNGYNSIQFRVGGRRELGGAKYHWVKADGTLEDEVLNASSSWCNSFWNDGEPSFITGGEDDVPEYTEYTMSMLRTNNGKWVFNDVADDILGSDPRFSGKIGYIIEYDE